MGRGTGSKPYRCTSRPSDTQLSVVGNASIRTNLGIPEGNLAIGIGQVRGDLRNHVGRVVAGETVRLSDIRQCGAQLLDKVADGETLAIEYRRRTVAALRPWRNTG